MEKLISKFLQFLKICWVKRYEHPISSFQTNNPYYIKASQCEIEDKASFISGVLTQIANLMVKDEDSDLKVKSFQITIEETKFFLV